MSVQPMALPRRRVRARPVRTGFDVLAAADFAAIAGRRVGVLTNPTAVTRELRHIVDVLAESDVDVTAVFGPEHGFRGTAQAGESEGTTTDPRTGLPVYDLYRASEAEIIGRAGIDVLVFDIQDVGARFYTYVWSMYRAMVAAAQIELPMVVLDRPNPIRGDHVGGPMLRPECASGVGMRAIPLQHGLTVGELAQLFNADFVPADAGTSVELTVVPMQGWRRQMDFDETALPWVLPSPNVPTVRSAFAYVGTGLFEGTNLSEGRGTTAPFEQIGAPYVDFRWADHLAGQRIPGIAFREAQFVPTFHKYVGETCFGVELQVVDRDVFDPIRTAVAMLVSLKRLYPSDFGWREGEPPFIDKLAGSDLLRTGVDEGLDVGTIVKRWADEVAMFDSVRQAHLLYRR